MDWQKFRWSWFAVAPRDARRYVALMVVLTAFGGYRYYSYINSDSYRPQQVYPDDATPISQLYVNDTLSINSANYTQLSRFGFDEEAIKSIMLKRDRGFVFRDESSWNNVKGIDSLWFSQVKLRIVYDQIQRDGFGYSSRKSKRSNYDPMIWIYSTSREKFYEYGLSLQIIDSIEAYKKLYYIEGQLPLSKLRSATPKNIGRVLQPVLKQRKSTKEKKVKAKQLPLVDINTATKEELLKVKYIGEQTANWIIEQRQRIGGFVDIRQLTEKPGFRQENFSTIAERVTCSETQLRRINVNTASQSELSNHPYIGRTKARSIIEARENEPISNFEELESIVDDAFTSQYASYYIDY